GDRKAGKRRPGERKKKGRQSCRRIHPVKVPVASTACEVQHATLVEIEAAAKSADARIRDDGGCACRRIDPDQIVAVLGPAKQRSVGSEGDVSDAEAKASGAQGADWSRHARGLVDPDKLASRSRRWNETRRRHTVQSMVDRGYRDCSYADGESGTDR